MSDPSSAFSVVLAEADDRTLVGRAVDGDTRAFAVIVARYAPLMRAYARRLLRSDDEVDDVVQESLIAAWERLGELRDASAVKSWLMRVVSYKTVDRIRRHRDHLDVDEIDPEDTGATTPEQAATERSGARALEAVLDALPDAQRRCWTLKEIGGFSYEEIAEQLGVPSSTVRGLLARARRTVMRGMEGWR